MITPRDFWNMRAETYDETSGLFYAEVNRQTAKHCLPYLDKEDRVLEFACGTGTITGLIAPHLKQMQAIDISDQMLEKAHENMEKWGIANVEISQMDIFDDRLKAGSYDAVLAFNVLCYIDHREAVLERIRDLLKPGGVFLSATDCLGEKITKAGLRKFWKSHTGSMPYVAFDSIKKLERAVEGAGFEILEKENLFPAPPNLFLAAKRNL